MEDFVQAQPMSEPAKTKPLEHWREVLNEDLSRINKKWDKKMTSTKQAHQKDRGYVTTHITLRFRNSSRTKSESQPEGTPTQEPPSNADQNNSFYRDFTL